MAIVEQAQAINQLRAHKEMLKLETTVYQYSAFMYDGMSGREFEEFFAELLRRNNYTEVTVTQSSGDYGGDVLAVDSSGKRICFQCKYHERDVDVSAVQEVFAACKYYGCDQGAVISRKSFTQQAKELASNIDVYLFDGHFIAFLMEPCLVELQTTIQDQGACYHRWVAAFAKMQGADDGAAEKLSRQPFAGKDECAVNTDNIEPNYVYQAESEQSGG